MQNDKNIYFLCVNVNCKCFIFLRTQNLRLGVTNNANKNFGNFSIAQTLGPTNLALIILNYI